MSYRKKLLLSIFLSVFVSFVVVLKVYPVSQIKADEDITSPEIVDLLLSKNEINTQNASDTVTIYARVSDDLSGVDWVGGSVIAEGSSPEISNQFQMLLIEEGDCSAIDVNKEGLVGCGDASDGIYQAEVEFLQGSPIGIWRLELGAIDVVGNDSGYLSYTDLESQFGAGTATINNIATTEDSESPSYIDHALSKASINTEGGADSLTMYLRLSDNMSGVEESPSLRMQSESTSQLMEFSFSLMTEGCDAVDINKDGLVGCGDNSDGIFSATVTFPQYSESGTWSLEGLVLTDNLGNQEDAEEGGDIDISFENTATIYDLTAPELKSLSITPTIFNTTPGDVTITIEGEIEDGLAGIANYADDGVDGFSFRIKPVVPSPIRIGSGGNMVMVGGTATDGTFRTTLVIPQYSKEGFWQFEILTVSDKLGNEKNYTANELTEMFPDIEGLILTNKALADEVVIDGEWTLSSDTTEAVAPDISFVFSEGTVVTKEAGGVFALYRLVSERFDIEDYDGGLSSLLGQANTQLSADMTECNEAEGCTEVQLNDTNVVGTPISILKLGIPGLNLTFSKPVTVILRVDEEYNGQTFVVQTFNEGTGEWASETSCVVQHYEDESGESGGSESGLTESDTRPQCRFTIDHASFFMTSVLGTDAGVPDTGLGGTYGSLLSRLLRWFK